MRNRIDQLRFSLRTSSRNAERLQHRCSTTFHGELRPLIASVIEQCDEAGIDAVHRLERLVVDVGDIELATFEHELQARVPAELARVLRQAMELYTDTGELCSASGATARWRKTQSGTATPPVPAATIEAVWCAVLRYLDTGAWILPQGALGRLPGNTRSDEPVPSPDVCLSFLLTRSRDENPEESTGIRLEMAARCLRTPAQRRLLATRDSRRLRALFDWLIAPTHITLPAYPVWTRLVSLAALLALQRYSLADQIHAIRLYSTTIGHMSETGKDAACPEDPSLEACLDELVSQPLTEPIRRILRDWLMSSVDKVDPTPWLSTLSLELQDRLTAAVEQHDVRSNSLQTSPQASRLVETTRDGSRTLTGERVQRSSVTSDDQPLIVSNAGLVLLWPMLPRLFSTLELTHENQWADPLKQRQAAIYLDWLAWGDALVAEWRLPMSRCLSGLPPLADESESIEWPTVDPATRAFLNGWLNTFLTQLPDLSRLSAIDLRSLFLQRPGTLSWNEGQWVLGIEPEGQDILLRTLPWPVTQVSLPWLARPLPIEWFR